MMPIRRLFGAIRNLTGAWSGRSKALVPVSPSRGGWLPLILESFAGAWQQNVTIDRTAIQTYHAVFACMTLIASDIAKLRVRLMRRDANGIWEETDDPSLSPLLRRPNPIQTRIQFWESWILSKLSTGNTYALKVRDPGGDVVRLYVLDPYRTQILVSDDGQVFYRLSTDNLSGIRQDVTVPAREILHDLMNPLFHPLIGLSPLTAAGLAAQQGLNIQTDSTQFFANQSMPSGVLSAPGAISNDTAERLAETWQSNYSGLNAGKVAVLGDGLKFDPIRSLAKDSQLIEQLKWSAEIVCSVFHVPPYKIGIQDAPAYNNIQALNTEYYSQALQILIEAAEVVMDDGLELAEGTGTEFDLDGLLRMDTSTQVAACRDAIGAGFMSPNEARRKFDLKPVKGGDTPYLQQQNYSLAALDDRDRQNPLAGETPTQAGQNSSGDDVEEEDFSIEDPGALAGAVLARAGVRAA